MDALSLHPAAVAALRRTVAGRTLHPTDPGYAVLAGPALPPPAAVVAAAVPADLAAVARVATEHGLGLRVRATGHGPPVVAPGGAPWLLLHTGLLDTVTVDASTGTAVVGAGATWGQVVAAAGVHGLAPVPLSVPGVGVAGSVLGGGLGPLARSHGLCADHVAALHVVGADGFERTVGAAVAGPRRDEPPVRGVTLRLDGPARVAVAHSTTDDRPRRRLRAWLRWTRSVPTTVTSSATLLTPRRGPLTLRLESVSPGGTTPVSGPAGRPAELPMTAWLARDGDLTPPGRTWRCALPLVAAVAQGASQGSPDDELAEALDDVLATLLAPAVGPTGGGVQDLGIRALQLRHLGGALTDSRKHLADLSAAQYLLLVTGVHRPGAHHPPSASVARLGAALRPWLGAASLPSLGLGGAPHALPEVQPQVQPGACP